MVREFGQRAAEHGQAAVVLGLKGPTLLVVSGGWKRQQLAQVVAGRRDQFPIVDDRDGVVRRKVAVQDCVVPDADRRASQITGQVLGNSMEVVGCTALEHAEDAG